jgi:capsule polysaccharide modification protein KpsS
VDRVGNDRDNEYLRPGRIALEHAVGWVRAASARALYDPLPAGRRFVYFPLHDTEDYKIKAVIPHCADQEAIVAQVADALPHGYDLVIKEHPQSIGRNAVSLLRRLCGRRNVRLVDPRTSSHELIRRSDGVVVISSTVGLEALLYGKPVLTLGQPFYAGHGITVDLDTFADIRTAVPALPNFHPDREQTLRFLHAAMERCYPGAPVLVDRSPENARVLARTLAEVAEDRSGVGAAGVASG